MIVLPSFLLLSKYAEIISFLLAITWPFNDILDFIIIGGFGLFGCLGSMFVLVKWTLDKLYEIAD